MRALAPLCLYRSFVALKGSFFSFKMRKSLLPGSLQLLRAAQLFHRSPHREKRMELQTPKFTELFAIHLSAFLILRPSPPLQLPVVVSEWQKRREEGEGRRKEGGGGNRSQPRSPGKFPSKSYASFD